LQEVTSNLQRVKSYAANFTVTMDDKGAKKVIDGRLKFRWPNLIRQEMKISPHGYGEELIVNNGQISWAYVPRFKMAVKYNLEKMDEDALERYGVVASYIDPDSITYIGNDVISQEKVYVFEGTPSIMALERGPENLEKSRIYIGIKDGIIRKVAFFNMEGVETYSQIFRDIKLDEQIPITEFEFEPPKDASVTEINDVGLQKIKAVASGTKSN